MCICVCWRCRALSVRRSYWNTVYDVCVFVSVGGAGRWLRMSYWDTFRCLLMYMYLCLLMVQGTECEEELLKHVQMSVDVYVFVSVDGAGRWVWGGATETRCMMYVCLCLLMVQGADCEEELLRHVQMSVSCTRLLIDKLQTWHVSNNHISFSPAILWFSFMTALEAATSFNSLPVWSNRVSRFQLQARRNLYIALYCFIALLLCWIHITSPLLFAFVHAHYLSEKAVNCYLFTFRLIAVK